MYVSAFEKANPASIVRQILMKTQNRISEAVTKANHGVTFLVLITFRFSSASYLCYHLSFLALLIKKAYNIKGCSPISIFHPKGV